MITNNLKEKREVEDIKKGLQNQAKKVFDNKKQVEVLQDEVNILKQQIENLEPGGATDLAQVATTGNYKDLVNKPNENFAMGASFKTNFSQIWGVEKKGEQTKDYLFLCAPDSVVEGRMTVVFKGSRRVTEINENMQFLFNGQVIGQQSYTILNATNTTFNFDFKVRPKKELNSFALRFTKQGSWVGECIIINVAFDISYGKNVFFLTRNFDWTATVYQDKYLISKNAYPNNVYYEKTKDDFDLSTGGVSVSTRLGKSLIFSYSPSYSPSSNFLTMNFSEILALGLDSDNYYPDLTMYNTLIVQRMKSQGVVHAYSITYFRNNVDRPNYPGIAAVIGEDRKLAFWEAGATTDHVYYYTLNSVPVENGIWVDNSAVVKQDMSDVNAKEFRGSVATRFDGENIFFPHFNSDYFVSVGFGRRVNVFLQDNENIHIYLGRQNHVVRKVLVKNTTSNQYEIDQNQELKIYGYDEIVETLDGYFIGFADAEPELVGWEEVL